MTLTDQDISLDSTISLSDEQVACELQGEMVVLSLADGEYYGLNPVAAAVWRHIENPVRVSTLRDALLNEFSGVTEERCTAELARLLAELRDLRLIRIA